MRNEWQRYDSLILIVISYILIIFKLLIIFFTANGILVIVLKELAEIWPTLNYKYKIRLSKNAHLKVHLLIKRIIIALKYVIRVLVSFIFLNKTKLHLVLTNKIKIKLKKLYVFTRYNLQYNNFIKFSPNKHQKVISFR